VHRYNLMERGGRGRREEEEKTKKFIVMNFV
jgi:hypothetical protein